MVAYIQPNQTVTCTSLMHEAILVMDETIWFHCKTDESKKCSEPVWLRRISCVQYCFVVCDKKFVREEAAILSFLSSSLFYR